MLTALHYAEITNVQDFYPHLVEVPANSNRVAEEFTEDSIFDSPSGTYIGIGELNEYWSCSPRRWFKRPWLPNVQTTDK